MDPHIINTKVQVAGQNLQICDNHLIVTVQVRNILHICTYKAMLLVLLLGTVTHWSINRLLISLGHI